MILLAIFTGLLATVVGFHFKDSGVSPYIVGGDEAKPGQFPYVVQLQVGFHDEHYCGGTIIGKNWVITAAHCMNKNQSEYTIIAGQIDLEVKENSKQSRSIKKVYIHPNYDVEATDYYQYDIALIEVDRPFVFNNQVKAIAIPSDPFHKTPAGTHAVIAGWGYLVDDAFYSATVLNYVEIAIVSLESCRKLYAEYSNWYPVLDSMICAGVPDGGKDSCVGDSGGPLVCTENGQDHLCGIMSFGVGCARKEFPEVNTRVSYFHDWILETIKTESTN